MTHQNNNSSKKSNGGNNNINHDPQVGRPSDERRKQLNQNLVVPMISNFFQLDRYYEVADKVYASFLHCYPVAVGNGDGGKTFTAEQNQALDDAFVYGKRYCRFCLDVLPEHNYYGSAKYKSYQIQHTRQVKQVLDALEAIADRMDQYELYRIEQMKEAARKKAEEEEQAELLRFAALQQRVEQQKKKKAQTSGIEASALSKLQLILGSGTEPLAPPASSAIPTRRVQPDPSGEIPYGQPSTKYALHVDDEDDDVANGDEMLPPPLLPLPPPSYDEVIVPPLPVSGSELWASYDRNTENQESITYPFHRQPSAPPAPGTTPISHGKKPRGVPFTSLQAQYEQDYYQHIQKGAIQVVHLDTYQGRVAGSTNGCTVISALVVSQHLLSGIVQNPQIKHVIDQQCIPLLREIRSKLGLGSGALIIPSDVHDHLVDKKLLPQEKFLGAAGGNILDKDHLGEFLKLLAQAPKQAGATLFFREHVISIVKYVMDDSRTGQRFYSYDLIDSLPGPKGYATRTHCQGLESLLVLLRWYASRKFSGQACQFIDKKDWDDATADVDPRVFQGFVWGEQPQ